MVEAKLIHPVAVEIKQKNEASTSFRSDAREPVRKMKRNATITLSAQVSWKRTDDPRATPGGVSEDSDGYLLFRFKDLDQAGVTLKRGDKVIKIDNRPYSLFLTQLKPTVHYPPDGAQMLKAFFADRNP